MTNGDCTHYNVWAWITWACAEYSDVDVIWMGHGTQVNGWSAYVTYDSIWDWGWIWGINYDLLYYGDDFASGTYDYSTLRVGIGDFCYGGGFMNNFLWPGGSVTHDRAFNGPELVSNTGYSLDFLTAWDDWWIPNHYNSYDSAHLARVAAQDKIQSGESGYSYGDTGTAVWC